MGWEIRGNHAYYYQKQRIGKKVKSVYIGKGEEARLMSRVDDIIRYCRKQVALKRTRQSSLPGSLARRAVSEDQARRGFLARSAISGDAGRKDRAISED